ncbi:MAG: S-layer homology domain-containing protein [Clostridia bacterium]|nr:S-layer homology domain-containing protein [Clostridia bacterium]
MKKIIALLLTLCLLLSIAPVAFAEEGVEDLGISPNHSADTVLEGETVIHFKQAASQGTWSGTESVKNYDGKTSRWANEKEAGLQFRLKNIDKGTYEVYYYIIYHSTNGAQWDFTVDHNGKTDETFAYGKGNGITESCWTSIGIFDFSGDGTEKVTMLNTSGGNIRASGLKLVPTDKPVVNPAIARKAKAEAEAEAKRLEEEERKANMIQANPYPGFSYEGNWNFSSTVPGPMVLAPASLWLANGQETDTCTYKPDIKSVGKVRIGVYLLYWHENQVADVKYEVHLGDGSVQEFHLDPTTDITKSSWVTLGEFDFDGSGKEFVKLVCVPQDNEKGNTRASTVRFEILNSADDYKTIWQTVYVTPDGSADLERAEALTKDLVSFTDMEDHWAKYDVSVMATKELVKGVAEGVFDPESTITRAEFVTILDRAMSYEMVEGESFADVAQDQWYAPYIATAKQNGLLNGLPVSDGFKPESPISREDMALFTYNAIKQLGKNDEWLQDLPNDWDNFEDTETISSYATDALKYLIQAGIIKGTSDTTVSPLETATRAQAAVILKRFMEGFVWAGPPTDEEWVLTFNDEFEYEGVNWDVWESASASPGHILSSRWPENIAVYDGAMHLLTKKEERGGKQWTTGDAWVTPNVFRQAYGYWEARYKYNESGGINNAFWMETIKDGYNFASDSDHRFEIDINEGHYPNKINQTYHTANDGSLSDHLEVAYDLSADYHTYALKWDKDFIYYYFDGELTSKKPNINAIDVVYPIFSTAVLNWAGTLGPKADGSSMAIEYVRIYQRREDAENKDITKINDPLPKKEVVVDPFPKVTTAEQLPDNEKYPGEIIIKPELEGTWNTSESLRYPDNSASYYPSGDGATAKYPLKELEKGKYRVLAWRLPHSMNARQINYMIWQNGEESYFGSVAIQPGFDDAKPGWVEVVPEFEYSGNKDDYILYTWKHEGLNSRALWFKFVPIQ